MHESKSARKDTGGESIKIWKRTNALSPEAPFGKHKPGDGTACQYKRDEACQGAVQAYLQCGRPIRSKKRREEYKGRDDANNLVLHKHFLRCQNCYKYSKYNNDAC